MKLCWSLTVVLSSPIVDFYFRCCRCKDLRFGLLFYHQGSSESGNCLPCDALHPSPPRPLLLQLCLQPTHLGSVFMALLGHRGLILSKTNMTKTVVLLSACWGGYSSVVEHLTADQEASGSCPDAPWGKAALCCFPTDIISSVFIVDLVWAVFLLSVFSVEPVYLVQSNTSTVKSRTFHPLTLSRKTLVHMTWNLFCLTVSVLF